MILLVTIINTVGHYYTRSVINPRTGPESDCGDLRINFPLTNRLVTFDSNRQTAPTISDSATELLLSIYVIRLP
ncbi:hypothetical protein GCM10025751_21970 [Haladaptatus pallidirubidus]|uniref:Uncharacterized protein n=1 Tax=Haladaptatus pallidirubidus TaxID=1008152 RepID=A0AAV3UGJ5_9EURY